MVLKVKAATDARQDQDFVIIARTDARTGYGLEEALRRGRAYRDAGADVIFIESPENVEELKAINEAFPDTPTLAIDPTGPLYAATKAVKEYMEALKATATTMGHIDRMIPFEDFNRLIGLPEYSRLEERYKV